MQQNFFSLSVGQQHGHSSCVAVDQYLHDTLLAIGSTHSQKRSAIADLKWDKPWFVILQRFARTPCDTSTFWFSDV